MFHRSFIALLGAVFLALTCSQAETSPQAPARRGDEPQYLALQVFTDSTSPLAGAGSQATDNGPPGRAVLEAFTADVAARIGSTGVERRRLALMFGPILFDHSDEQAVQLIDDVFDIALTRGVAVGFHLDDSMSGEAGAISLRIRAMSNVRPGTAGHPPSAGSTGVRHLRA